jgi:nucleoside-diphosphate-sugar epimerase
MYELLKNGKAKYVTNHKRDWIHVKDVCRAIRYLVNSDLTGPVTIGTGKSVAVTDLAKAFGQGHLPVLEDTKGERQDNVADISIMKSIGWFPTIDVLSTI